MSPVRRRRLVIVLGIFLAAVAIVAAALVGTSSDADAAPTLEELKTGVGKVETLNCDGSPFMVSGGPASGSAHAATGTGFLIGSRVLMTAEHGMYVGVDEPACKMRVRFGAETYPVTSVRVWGEPGQRDAYARSGVDLATLTLGRPVEERHQFKFAPAGAPTGTKVATIGYPMGGPLKVTRGTVTRNVIDYEVPSVAAKIDIQGGNSGGPIFNERGEVISTVSRIVISGSLTLDKSNRHGGVDIPRWWGENAWLDLCRVYPDGGLPDCDESDDRPTTKTSVLLSR